MHFDTDDWTCRVRGISEMKNIRTKEDLKHRNARDAPDSFVCGVDGAFIE